LHDSFVLFYIKHGLISQGILVAGAFQHDIPVADILFSVSTKNFEDNDLAENVKHISSAVMRIAEFVVDIRFDLKDVKEVVQKRLTDAAAVAVQSASTLPFESGSLGSIPNTCITFCTLQKYIIYYIIYLMYNTHIVYILKGYH